MLLRHRPMWMRGEVIAAVACLAFGERHLLAAEGDVAEAGARPEVPKRGEGDVPTDELRRVPGALGDVGKALESLPGVARPGAVTGGPLVWGADPGETRVLVDGMEIPTLYHLGGFRSVLGSPMVESLALLRGGFGAELGRALGGVVSLETRSPPLHGYFGYIDANVLDASFAAGAGLDGGGVAVAGRWSYLGSITNEAPSDAFGLNSSLRYRDLQAKALLALRPGEKVELISLYSSDFESPDYVVAWLAPFPSREQSFFRVGARYTRNLAGGGSVIVLPFVGWERSRTTFRRFMDVVSSISDLVSLSGKDVGLRVSYRKPLTTWLTAELGFDGLVTWSTLNRLGEPRSPLREGDIAAWGQQPFCCGIARDSWTDAIGNLAPTMSLEIASGKWLLIPSFRADAEFISGDRKLPAGGSPQQERVSRLTGAPAPRLFVSHQSSSRVRNHLAIGLYNQPPSPADMSSVFGSPLLGGSHALHAVAGTTVALVPGFTVEGTAFYRKLWALVTRSPNPSPALGESLVQDGQGRAWGAEVLVHFTRPSFLSGWLSYTFSRSERRQSASASYRLFDYDQTHVFSAVATASYAGFSLGGRFRLASGMPRTPVIGAYYSSSVDNYGPIFGAHNSERLPTFCALDLRVEKVFYAKSIALTPYLEGINVTNRKNAEDFTYSQDFSHRAPVAGLPRTLVAGIALKY